MNYLKFFKKNALTLVLLIGSFSVLAQAPTYKIKGKIVDQTSRSPLIYATVSIMDMETGELIAGVVTDEQGYFKMKAPAGVYNIKAQYVSYHTKTIPNTRIDQNIDLGEIGLTFMSNTLNEIVIRAEKTQVQIRLDKKIYNLGKDLTTQGTTVTDALSNVPSVSVSIDGAISLRGNENVKILINGKPSALAGFGSDALQQLPAEAIEKVEVITSPSARYTAEGTAGIINIILKREETLGFNGSISANFGLPTSGGVSGNINYRTQKFNFFNTLGYYYRDAPGEAHYSNRYFDQVDDAGNVVSPTFDKIIEDRDMDRLRRGFYTNLGVEYYINDQSSLIASGFLRLGDDEVTTTNTTNRFLNEELKESSIRKEIENEDDKSYQLSLNYFNNFNDKGHKLTANLQYETDTETNDTYISELIDYPTPTSFPSEMIDEKETEKEFLFKADYVLPMGDAQFEAGLRSNIENSVTDYVLQKENATGDFEVDKGLTNIFDYTEIVNAAYAQYGNKFGDFSFLLGLRLESTRMKGSIDSEFDNIQDLEDELGIDVVADFDKHYLGLFPTLNLTYQLGKKESVTLGYNRRINRPRGWFINPFPSRSSRTNIFQGNPNLDPAFANTFDLGYMKRWDDLTLTTSIYYKHEENAFERVQESTGKFYNGVEIIRSIPINLATNDSYGFEAGLLYNPFKWWHMNGSFNYFKYTTDGKFNGVDYGASSSSWFGRFSSRVTLPGKVEWQTTASYRGPRETAQTKREGVFSLNLGFSKDLFNNNATIALNVRDLLNSRKRNSITSTPQFISESEFQWRSRSVNLSLTYRFNQSKQKAKKNFEGEGGMEGGF